MTLNRRNFLRTSALGAAAGATTLFSPASTVSAYAPQAYPQIQSELFVPVHFGQKPQDGIGAFTGDELGSLCLPYTHVPTTEESYRLYRPHDQNYNCNYMVANVMDKEGKKYNIFREFKAFDSINNYAFVEVADGVTYAQPIVQPGEMYRGKSTNDLVDGAIRVGPYLADPGAFSVEMKPQKAHWMDANGRFVMDFKGIGPSLEYYCPGLYEDTMYRSEPYFIKGTVDGKDVKGFGLIETAWGTNGITWEQSKIFRHLEEYWVVWLNVYDDDTLESGVYMDGVAGFGCGFYNRNGDAIVGGKVPADVTRTADDFLQSVKFAVGDQQFEFTMDARVMQVPNFLSWASGHVTRAGETRTPKMSFSWFEFLPKR